MSRVEHEGVDLLNLAEICTETEEEKVGPMIREAVARRGRSIASGGDSRGSGGSVVGLCRGGMP